MGSGDKHRFPSAVSIVEYSPAFVLNTLIVNGIGDPKRYMEGGVNWGVGADEGQLVKAEDTDPSHAIVKAF